MPFSRFLVSSFGNRSKVSLNLLRESGFCRRLQCRRYTGSPKDDKRKLYAQPLFSEKPLDSHSRSWNTYIIPAGLLLIAGVGTLVHYNDEKRAVLKGSGQSPEFVRDRTKGPTIGGPFRSGQSPEFVRDRTKGPTIGGPFSLIDTEHRQFTERDLLGSWVLLYFGYTSSPDVGPEQVQKMAKAIDTLESKQKLKVEPIFITIDPQRDSPSQLKAYLKEFDPRIIGLSGMICAIRQIAQEFRVFFKRVEEDGGDYLVETSHNMYLLNPNMEMVRCFGVQYDAGELSEEILKEVNKPIK